MLPFQHLCLRLRIKEQPDFTVFGLWTWFTRTGGIFLISCHSTTAEEDGAEWMAAPDT